MVKVKVLMCEPMRSSAAMRAGLVKELARKVIVTSLKRTGAARTPKSWQANRREARSSVGRQERKFSRVFLVHQKWRNAAFGFGVGGGVGGSTCGGRVDGFAYVVAGRICIAPRQLGCLDAWPFVRTMAKPLGNASQTSRFVQTRMDEPRRDGSINQAALS